MKKVFGPFDHLRHLRGVLAPVGTCGRGHTHFDSKIHRAAALSPGFFVNKISKTIKRVIDYLCASGNSGMPSGTSREGHLYFSSIISIIVLSKKQIKNKHDFITITFAESTR